MSENGRLQIFFYRWRDRWNSGPDKNWTTDFMYSSMPPPSSGGSVDVLEGMMKGWRATHEYNMGLQYGEGYRGVDLEILREPPSAWMKAEIARREYEISRSVDVIRDLRGILHKAEGTS